MITNLAHWAPSMPEPYPQTYVRMYVRQQIKSERVFNGCLLARLYRGFYQVFLCVSNTCALHNFILLSHLSPSWVFLDDAQNKGMFLIRFEFSFI